MSEVLTSERTKLADKGGPASALSETFRLLQAESEPETVEGARLERLIGLIETCERQCRSALTKAITDDWRDGDEDPEVDPPVLIEVTTKSNGAEHHQYLFEDLSMFRSGLNKDRIILLRATRSHGQLRPEALARLLGRDLSGVLGDIRQLTLLGLIDETSRGVRVDYDELILAIRINK
jgi:predicted transcriptional regulator